MHHFVYISLIFLLCQSLAIPVWAKEKVFAPAPAAKSITMLNGLTLGNVNTLMQSRNGFIWLGTNEGLIRFDGYNAKRFVNTLGDRHTLSQNKVMGIVEDSAQNLWISTYGGGLNKFIAKAERFEKIDLRLDPMDKTNTDLLYSLTLSDDNTLWIGSQNGLKRLDIDTQKAIALPQALSVLSTKETKRVFIDRQKQLWVTTSGDGVYWYDNVLLHHFTDSSSPDNALVSNNVHQVNEDQQGNIWLATAQGLNQFNRAEQRFSRFIAAEGITALKADHKGQLWLGSKANGIHQLLPDSQQIIQISGEKDIQQQFNRKSINEIVSDNQGTLWFATKSGIILLSKTALNIQYLTNTAASLLISDIELLKNDTAAFAGNYQFYDYDIAKNTAQSRFANENRLYKITANPENDLWLATIGQGLQHFSQADDQLQQIEHTKPLDSPLPIIGLFDAYLDNMEQIWLMPFPDLPHLAGGVIRFDPQTRSYETYLSRPFISDILQMADNELLLSSDSAGLITLNTDTKAATHWQKTIPTTPRRIFTVLKDSQHNLWLGTREQGLALFNPQQQKFEFFTTADGLLSNNIHSIVEDDKHHLWLGTPNGLSRFDPANKQVLNLEQQDGLLFSSFYKRASVKTNNGQLLLGTDNGLVVLNPDNFSQKNTAIPVIISDFKLFNQSVDWQKPAENTILEHPIGFTEELVLTHEDDMFSFTFSATEYLRPDKIKFAYKMENLNKKWLYTDATNRVASYTTLRPGDYVFKVKATNRDGVWNEQATSIKLTVLAPWWLSWQAYIVYLVLSLASVYLVINYRTKKLVRRAEALEDNVAQRTQELQNSRDQVSDLLAQKQQLFASMSHEFRTPLTLILSPIDHLLSNPKGQHITKELSLIKRNGRRLLRMVDQLLEFAKLELHDNSQMEQISLKQTLQIIISSFEPLVKSKNIGLSVNDYQDATLNMLPDSLNKILINILSNAFKYSPNDSQISVIVSNHSDRVDIAISDTGIGIGESDLEAVFQRFNRATHGHGEAIPGAGIGLALVKELVEANQGEIALTSVLQQGSTFTVTLPVMSAAQTFPETSDDTRQKIIHEHIDLEIDSVHTTSSAAKNDTITLTDSSQKSILIIDDNPDLRNLLNDQLSDQYQCLQAENGQIGLDIARDQLPDLVISDVMMPVMDGYQLTSALKGDELTSHIPVILLTAKGSMENRLKGLQLLVDDYLAKPFNIEELTLRIHNILTLRDIVKQRFKQVIDEVNPQSHMDQLSVNEIEQSFINKVNKCLSQYHCDDDFSAKILSRELGVSERQLQRKLKAQFDLGFPELLRNYRLNKAIEMLSSGQRVSQIYHTVGFASHSYFSSCFKAKFGKTPKAYQQGLE